MRGRITTALPILMLKFDYQGNPTRETITLYGRLEGATRGFRAIGYVDKKSRVHVYSDDELLILMRDWRLLVTE